MPRDSNKDLNNLINSYSALKEWKNRDDIRLSPKQKNSARLAVDHFLIKDVLNSLELKDCLANKNYKILFAHFSPFLNELEGLGLPAFASRFLPNCLIDFTYDKGNEKASVFRIIDDKILKLDQLEEKYDLIIARSSVLINMMKRQYDKTVLENSSYKINIKTMSYKPNYKFADYYFDEEDMCPPADPSYLQCSNTFLEKNRKENLIAVSGTLWKVKNQLSMFEQLDPDITKDYSFVILGPERDISYTNRIRQVCENKRLKYFLVGSVCRELACEIKSLSKLSIIPMDMRVFGQPKGYPRTLGESIGSKCLTICNKPVTIPAFYKDTCRVYNEEIPNDLNLVLEKSIRTVSDKNFITQHNWGTLTFNDICKETIIKCLNLYEQNHKESAKAKMVS
jgi:glycosyltransferase involved in cell wall biosynthesis